MVHLKHDKPATRTATFAAVCTVFAQTLFLSALPAAAAPTGGNNSTIKNVWIAKQVTEQGTYEIGANDTAIRIYNKDTTGGLIAKAPAWKLTIFNDKNKEQLLATHEQWLRRVEGHVDFRSLGKPQKREKICGLEAVVFCFKVNAYTNRVMDSLFSTRTQTFIKDRTIAFDASSDRLPAQVVAVWDCFLQIPISNHVPLRSVSRISDGKTTSAFNTVSFECKSVPANYFDLPHYPQKANRSWTSIFFGTQKINDFTEDFFK